MKPRKQNKSFSEAKLTDIDVAAGVSMEMTTHGLKLRFPAPTVAKIHRDNENNRCPGCKKFFRECKCEIDPTKLPNKIHQARPWGWKGPQVLPESHPDHPKHKSNSA